MQQPKGVSMGMLDFITSPVASLAGGALSFLGQQGANQQNMENAQAQMAFQKEMSNTSYQRAVEDMKAAGLSPMLAYSQGGASVPTGAMPVVQNKLGAGVEAFQRGLTSSSAAALQNVQQDQVKSQTVLNSANAALAQANADKAKAETVNTIATTPNIEKTLEKIAAEIQNLQAGAKAHSAIAAQTTQRTAIEKPQAEFAKNQPKWAEYLSPVSQSIGTILNAIKGIRK